MKTISKNISLFLLLFLVSFTCYGVTPNPLNIVDTLSIHDSLNCQAISSNEFPFLNTQEIYFKPDDSTHINPHKNKKLIAAILAFPFPFGMLGLHRLYLGTKPYMPFVYIGTVGGCLLILPFIDFCAILVANHEQMQHFENNTKVFMWSR